MGVCNCSLFCCTLLYVHSSIAIILMGKRGLVALLSLCSWCLVMVERHFLTVPQGYVAAVERLPALHYSVDFIFLSFGFMGFIAEL